MKGGRVWKVGRMGLGSVGNVGIVGSVRSVGKGERGVEVGSIDMATERVRADGEGGVWGILEIFESGMWR